MTKIFIGGSRRIARINPLVRVRLDKIIQKNLPVVIGDANGADKAVQAYFRDNSYPHVEIFCMEGRCRNNLGGWKTRVIAAPPTKRGSEFYSVKDEEMTSESSIGLMLWDGQSKGTLANVARLIQQHKKAVVYIAPLRSFETVRDKAGLDKISHLPGATPRGRAFHRRNKAA